MTDHVNIDWDGATIIGRESDRTTRSIKETVKTSQECQDVMNRDNRAYQLIHVYDNLLLSMATSCRERKSAQERQQLLLKMSVKIQINEVVYNN